MQRTATLALAVVLAFGLMAGPALAQGGPSLERGNWLSDVAEPVDLNPGDVTFETLVIDGEELHYIRVGHDVKNDYEGYDLLVQREPNRIGGENAVTDTRDPDEQFNAAWMQILGPEGPSVQHKGTFSWYYRVDHQGTEWVSLNFTFDGQGNLLHVNGVEPQ